MTDRIRADWLDEQFHEAMSFAQRSSVLNLAPIDGAPPYKYIAEFRCKGLACEGKRIVVVDRHLVGILFPEQYVRTSCDPGQVLTWLEPTTAWHPNIRAPFACVGPMPPGMPLLALLHQLYQMITWQRFTLEECKALNRDACSWARSNLDRFPVDERRSMLGKSRHV